MARNQAVNQDVTRNYWRNDLYGELTTLPWGITGFQAQGDNFFSLNPLDNLRDMLRLLLDDPERGSGDGPRQRPMFTLSMDALSLPSNAEPFEPGEDDPAGAENEEQVGAEPRAAEEAEESGPAAGAQPEASAVSLDFIPLEAEPWLVAALHFLELIEGTRPGAAVQGPTAVAISLQTISAVEEEHASQSSTSRTFAAGQASPGVFSQSLYDRTPINLFNTVLEPVAATTANTTVTTTQATTTAAPTGHAKVRRLNRFCRFFTKIFSKKSKPSPAQDSSRSDSRPGPWWRRIFRR